MCGARKAATRVFGLLSGDYTESKRGFFFFGYCCHLNNISPACLAGVMLYSQAVIVQECCDCFRELMWHPGSLPMHWKPPEGLRDLRGWKRFPSHPSEAVRMSWSLVTLGRIFLSLNGATATDYTINLHVAPGKKYMLPEALLGEKYFICRRFVLAMNYRTLANFATKCAKAVKARQRVKEGTIKGWQGRSRGGYRENPASRKVHMKDLVWKLVTKVKMKQRIPSWYLRG